MNPKRSESIKKFLELKSHPDLAAMYNREMEVQVLVAEDNGTRVDKEYHGKNWHAYSDGVQTWQTFRIPLNAWATPEDNDKEMTYDLSQHALGIGMTGWNWVQKKSIWVAYDFDSMLGHSEKHRKKLTDDELQQLISTVENIEWVTLRKSTSGKGLHLYVTIDPTINLITDNHNEHMALARAILEQLASICCFDFQSKVDTTGGNMWVWHRKMLGTDGLSLIKSGTTLKEVPPNWRDHIDVIAGKCKKIVPFFIKEASCPDEMEQLFNELSGQSKRVPLDNDHNRLLAWLRENGGGSWWSSDHWMLVTHTTLLERAHKELGLKGIFKTLAKGTEHGDHNCFSGATSIITKQGVRTLKDIAENEGHAELYVWTGSKFIWKDCEIKSFGIQKTIPITFGDYTTVRATKNHRWPYYNRDNERTYIDSGNYKYTTQLIPTKTEIPIAKFDLPSTDNEDYRRGYAHGFVYGDGWLRNTRGKITSEVKLFKRDNDLFKLLNQYGTYGTEYVEGHGYINTIRQLPAEWKALPENPSKSYALGFVLGLVSADGFVNKRIQISHKNWHEIHEIRNLAIYAGLRALCVREAVSGKDSFKPDEISHVFTITTYNLTKEYFIRKDHQENFEQRTKHSRITIIDIDYENEKEEEVYCAIVPEYENFTLANHVITLNCFAYPRRNGAWLVYRYTRGCAEDKSWTQDGSGWTRCYYNLIPDLSTACRAYGADERPSGGYVFREFEVANQAMAMLGVNLPEMPVWTRARKTTIKKHKDGRLVIEFQREDMDPADQVQGWLPENKLWKKVIDNKVASEMSSSDVPNFDKLVRHLINEADENAGWAVKSDNEWHIEPLEHVKSVLAGPFGCKNAEVKAIIGSAVITPWTLVCKPFEPEYPKDRQWNRNAPQLRFTPSPNVDTLSYPTWAKILNHLGDGLTDAILESEWARTYKILTGGDYLKIWLASLIQQPTAQLPYLFFWSDKQNVGKSTFHEAIALLMTHGVVRADQALTSASNFNGELENAVLGVIEETDLNKGRGASHVAYNRIKDWVTSKYISIHRKTKTPYNILNTMHFIHCMPSDTWIFTNDGPRQIKDLINNPFVAIVDGRKYKSGSEGFFSTGKKEVFEIETTQGYTLQATSNHKILTNYGGISLWQELGNLKPGNKIHLHNHQNAEWGGKGTFEEGYVLGYLLGDGTIFNRNDSNCEIFNIPIYDDFEIVGYLLSILDKCSAYRTERGFTIAGKQLNELCREFNIHKKNDIKNLEECSSEFYEGLLSGLFDTDGTCADKNDRGSYSIDLFQSDIDFLKIVQRFLIRLGIFSSIYKSRDERKLLIHKNNKETLSKKSYYLSITTKAQLQIFLNRIGFKIHRKQQMLKKRISQAKRKITPNRLATIKSIKSVGIKDTYDCTIPEVHYFDANGIVAHNCANDRHACPVFSGDSRIVVIYVDPFPTEELIPRPQLTPMLEKEAPDFLAELLRLDIPPSNDRLNVPIIQTQEKLQAQEESMTVIELFLRDYCHYVPGRTILWDDLYQKFIDQLEPAYVEKWTKNYTGSRLPTQFPKGRWGQGGKWHIGNISFYPKTDDEETKPKLILRNHHLVNSRVNLTTVKNGEPSPLKGVTNDES